MALYAFDGTNDDNRQLDADAERATNVWQFYCAYDAATRREGISNVYIPGVGTRFGPIGRVVGGAFGSGWLPRIDATYKALCAAYAGGDKVIDVIGFSRGAAIALDFVNKVNRDGIQQDGKVVEAHPPIRFLGLFDTVAAFGVANLGFIFARANIGHDLDLPQNVRSCFHAMALDEKRPQFVVTRVKGAYEVWFRGVHSDIGGGNGNEGLNNITLQWMAHKAAGVGISLAALDQEIGMPDAPIDPNFFDRLSVTWRSVPGQDRVHYTVKERPDCNKFPAGCAVETADDEVKRVSPV